MHRVAAILLTSVCACVNVSDGEIVERETARLSETTMEWYDDPGVLIPDPYTPVPQSYSVVMRTDTHLAAFVSTTEMVPGHIFHLWHGAFNVPEACETPFNCVRTDQPNDRTVFTSIFGRVTGKVNAEGQLRYAGKPIEENDGEYTRFGRGMRDALNDEIVIFARNHGPIIEDFPLQRGDGKSYDGGCTLSGIADHDFECYIPQIARHFRQIEVEAGATTREMAWCEHDGESRSGEFIAGSKSVVVSNSRLAMGYVDTFGLRPQAAISLWWAAFGNPEACAGGPGACTIADLENPDTDPLTVDTGIGDIVKDDGLFLQTASPISAEDLGGRSTAELLLVLRDHGPYSDEHYYDLRFEMNPGCEVNGKCVDVQYSRHIVTGMAAAP